MSSQGCGGLRGGECARQHRHRGLRMYMLANDAEFAIENSMVPCDSRGIVGSTYYRVAAQRDAQWLATPWPWVVCGCSQVLDKVGEARPQALVCRLEAPNVRVVSSRKRAADDLIREHPTPVGEPCEVEGDAVDERDGVEAHPDDVEEREEREDREQH